ncbi:hypothetical protein AAMO2058_000280900 [Amorphochlora amoebiformis]
MSGDDEHDGVLAGTGEEEEKMVASAPPMMDAGAAQSKIDSSDSEPAQNVFEVDMAILFVTSLVVLTAAGKICHEVGSCRNQLGYAVAVGSLGFISSLTYLFILKRSPDYLVPLNSFIGVANGIFWTVSVGVLTFDRPFSSTGNGYFATWVSFLAAMHFMYHSLPRLQNFFQQLNEGAFQQWNRKILLVIFLASIIEVFAAANACSISSKCTKYYGWAVACGTISIVFIGVLLFVPFLTTRFLHYFSGILFVWWVIGSAIMTYDAPFVQTGNGYFACWIAVLASFHLLYFSLFGSEDHLTAAQQPYESGAYQEANSGSHQDHFPSAEL